MNNKQDRNEKPEYAPEGEFSHPKRQKTREEWIEALGQAFIEVIPAIGDKMAAKAWRDCNPPPVPAWSPDVVLTPGGKLVEILRSTISRLQDSMSIGGALEFAGARGGSPRAAKPTDEVGLYEYPAEHNGKKYRVRFLIHGNPSGSFDILLFLLDETGTQAIAPFTVNALGPDGTPIAEKVAVTEKSASALFPQARPGCYTFRVEWGVTGLADLKLKVGEES